MKQQSPRRYMFIAELDTQQDLSLLLNDPVYKTLLRDMDSLAEGEVLEGNFFENGPFRRYTSH